MNTQGIKEISDKVITGKMEAVRSHPGIAALLGLGVSWFIVDKMFKRHKTVSGEIIAESQEKIEQLQEKTAKYAESQLPDLKESAIETGQAIVRKSQSALEGVSGYMDENPMMTGFIGLAAGSILGILTSRVLMENGLIGETRQAVQNKTKQILHETKEKAGHVVNAAVKAARDEAERKHFIPH